MLTGALSKRKTLTGARAQKLKQPPWLTSYTVISN